jgi:hypothetical protein
VRRTARLFAWRAEGVRDGGAWNQGPDVRMRARLRYAAACDALQAGMHERTDQRVAALGQTVYRHTWDADLGYGQTVALVRAINSFHAGTDVRECADRRCGEITPTQIAMRWCVRIAWPSDPPLL